MAIADTALSALRKKPEDDATAVKPVGVQNATGTQTAIVPPPTASNVPAGLQLSTPIASVAMQAAGTVKPQQPNGQAPAAQPAGNAQQQLATAANTMKPTSNVPVTPAPAAPAQGMMQTMAQTAMRAAGTTPAVGDKPVLDTPTTVAQLGRELVGSGKKASDLSIEQLESLHKLVPNFGKVKKNGDQFMLEDRPLDLRTFNTRDIDMLLSGTSPEELAKMYEDWRGPTSTATTAAPGAGNNTNGRPATSPITGDEVPVAINPGRSSELTELLALMKDDVQRQLENPTAYDDELFSGMFEQGTRLLDERFQDARNRKSAELARRGVSYGGIAGNEFDRLETEQARAEKDLMLPLLRERALTLASGRNAASGALSNLTGLHAGLERGERDELRGERAYTDDLRRTARSDSIQEFLLGEQLRTQEENQFMDILARSLGFSDTLTSAGILGGAGDLFGNAANAYGARAGASNDAIGSLAQALLLFYGGN
jgi:hypothetical protein